MSRASGWSVRVKLTLSYAGFLMLAGSLLMAVVWLFLLRYVPDRAMTLPGPGGRGGPGGEGPSLPAIFIPGRSDLWTAFAPKAALALALLLVFGVVGGWLLSGRMLAPLHRITAATSAAGEGSLSHRIRLPGRNDEFRELADAFDAMMARLESHVAEQQRFAANASHELRTPLAVTHTLLEVARKNPADPTRDTGQLLDRLQVVNNRAIDLTEALLLLSRADHRSNSCESVDLSLAVEEATETLLTLAEAHDITIETAGDQALALGSPALLMQLTTNLVHNAIVHNLPERGRVWVTTSADADGVALTVENTGARLDPGLIDTLTEPFQRGAQRTHTGANHGVGLGLAIVKRIIDTHDGRLALDARPDGGLRVVVHLPTAPDGANVSPADRRFGDAEADG